MTRWRIVLALVVAGTWPAWAGGHVPVASAQPVDDPPAQVCPGFDYCLGDEGPVDPGGDPGTGPGPGGPGTGDPARRCTTQPFGAAVVGGDYGAGLPNDVGPAPSPDAVLMYTECEGEAVGHVWWWQPGEPEAPPQMTAAELAGRARVRLEGNLPAPAVSTSPPGGVAAILGFPSFVAVDNWTGTVTDGECDPNYPRFCIEITAEPALSWSPGEPGADPVACAGAGTVFDPAGGDVDDQAAPPACAHAYRTRTGVWGRPAEWPGVVTVHWALTYTSPSGDGTLPDVVKSTPLPRAVDEVQTVVESAG
jgi:hypothetical protein